MEYAIYNHRIISATEVALNYELEKIIRKASSNKELICRDTNCGNKILRYCHGEVKGAYFAHLNNCHCDYAEFDKNNEILRPVRRRLYEHFKGKGYDVELEVKVLKHHYTSILFKLQNGKKIALELGTKRTTAKEIEELTVEYAQNNIECKWIVVDDNIIVTRENEMCCLKRFLVNESKNKDVVIVSTDGYFATQSKKDSNTYNDRPMIIDGYGDMFIHKSSLENLELKGTEITFEDFDDNYNEWLEKKKLKFDEKTKEIEKVRSNHWYPKNRFENYKKPNQSTSAHVKSRTTKTHPQGTYFRTFQELEKADFNDPTGRYYYGETESGPIRWGECNVCGEIKEQMLFYKYDGKNENRGVCRDCFEIVKPSK